MPPARRWQRRRSSSVDGHAFAALPVRSFGNGAPDASCTVAPEALDQ